MEQKNSGISVFQRYLTIWVALCMVVGVLIGRFLPHIPDFLDQFEYAGKKTEMDYITSCFTDLFGSSGNE